MSSDQTGRWPVPHFDLFKNNNMNTGEAERLGRRLTTSSKPSTNKAGEAGCQIPSRGLWAVVQTIVPLTVLAWGAVNLATDHTGRDSLGDWAKNPAANSSTMKGSNRIGEGELASESYGRRCRTATPLLWSVGMDADHWVPRPSAFSGGN